MTAFRIVRQIEPCGCLVACLAMVTGRTYTEIREAFPANYDFTSGGMTHHEVQQYLGDRSIPNQLRYRFELGRNRVGDQVVRRDWPHPFAPVHIIGINGGRHGVVLLPDGMILDPMADEPRRYMDVGEVSYMVGVWPGIRLSGLE